MMITIWMEALVLSMTVILIHHKMNLNINNTTNNIHNINNRSNNSNNSSNNNNSNNTNNTNNTNNRNKPSMERGAMIFLLFTMRMFVLFSRI